MTTSIDSGDLHRAVPFGKWEIVDVIFPTGANTDYVIPHSLNPSIPTDVQYQILRQTTAGTIYEGRLAAGSKPWTSKFIILRSDTASWTGRLLLTLLKNPITFEAV